MWFLLLKGFKSKGVHMIILNILRICTLVGLASVMAASWALAIKINMSKPFFVFDAASLVFMSMIATFLFVSELPWGNKFFENNWPAFGPNKGIGWLGLALIMIGCNMLGKLNNNKVEPDEIGGPWYSLILAAGIMNLAFGVLNIIFGLLFGSGSSNARAVRGFGASPQADKLPYDNASSFHEKGNEAPSLPRRVLGKLGGAVLRRGADRVCKDTPPSRRASAQAYDLERNSHPYQASHAGSRGDSAHHFSGGSGDDDRLTHRNEALNRLSGGDQDSGSHSKPLTSPIAPNVPRPDTLMHPLYLNKPDLPASRVPSSVYSRNTTYSEAHNVSRFSERPPMPEMKFPAGDYSRV